MKGLGLVVAVFLAAFGSATVADEAVWQVQSQLRFLGYAPGPSDGAMGRGTQSAIDAFYEDNGQTPPNDLAIVGSDLRAAVEARAAHLPASGMASAALFDTPYPIPAPAFPRSYFDDTFRAVIDIDNDGVAELFAMKAVYSPSASPDITSSSPAKFFRRGDVGQWDEITGAIENPDAFCLHPRTAAIGDYNGDGVSDVFVACHGFDAAPYAGEKNRVLLSQPSGSYKISTPSDVVAFFHGAASADFDGDGDLDVVATDNQHSSPLHFFWNDGAGNFTHGPHPIPRALRGKWPAFVVKTLDANGDGIFDLFVAGHDWDHIDTQVFLNDGSGDFSRSTPIRVPPVAGFGVVLDVVATGEGDTRALWINRTSGGAGSFYQGRLIQRFDMTTREGAEVWRAASRWTPNIAAWRGEGGRRLVGNDDGWPALDVSQYE